VLDNNVNDLVETACSKHLSQHQNILSKTGEAYDSSSSSSSSILRRRIILFDIGVYGSRS